MSHRLLNIFLSLLVGFTIVVPAAHARDRDPLAPVHAMEATQFEAFPPEAIAQPNADAIVALVNEAREFGVPLAVRVVSMPTDEGALSDFGDLDLTQPIPEDTVHEMARAWMAEEPVESSPGAEDGFLMLVVMPKDHSLTSAVIEPGPNALPLNGITRENIDQVMQDLVMPRFANNEVSQGIRTGLSIFSYNNLFGVPNRTELDNLHQDLQRVADVPLAGITTASAVGLVALAFWISRRPGAVVEPQAARPLSPFEAAALSEGRVNDAVMTGGMLDLIRARVLVATRGRSMSLRIEPARMDDVTDPFLLSIASALQANADEHGNISEAATRRLHDLMAPGRVVLENELARRGLFNKDARVELMWLMLASGLVGAIALFTLLPSLLGMAGFGILAIIFSALCIAGTLGWCIQRSWTTPHGREALALWSSSAPLEERAAFDTITNQDALISAQGGPIIPETVEMVRALRGIGAT
jgi:hypothetical protein